MEILTLNRRIFTNKSTIGDIFLRGDWFCNSLEDTCRSVKIKNETCIPDGRYEVVLVNSPRYKRVMPRLLNVPGYEGVLIHWGNQPSDTDGCVLVGLLDPEHKDWISQSRKTFDQLFEKLMNIHDEHIWMTITGGIKNV